MATTEVSMNTPAIGTPASQSMGSMSQQGVREGGLVEPQGPKPTETGKVRGTGTGHTVGGFHPKKGLLSVAERASERLNTFGPFHGSANCLAEMRAQSPPRSSPSPSPPSSSLCLSSSASGESEAQAMDHAAQAAAAAAAKAERHYASWMAKHPSALQEFDKFISLVNGRRLAVFLDYDGTLSPIVEDPDRAIMSPGMRDVVREVASQFPTAIISGRGREKVYNFVQLSELYYAGSHGMDIMMPLSLSSSCANGTPTVAPSWHEHLPGKGANGTPDTEMNGGEIGKSEGGCRGESGVPVLAGSEEALFHDPALETRSSDANGHDVVLFQPAKQFAPIMEQVFAELTERAKAVPGACIENNNFCVTIHFRRVKEELWDQLADIVSDVVTKYSSLRTTHGRKVLEIRPKLEWNKGKAVSYLLHTLGLTDCKEVMPIYIGDDRTDEDAFLVLNERGNGCGIVVAASAKSTVANFSLRDPSEVMQFLHKLVVWSQQLKQQKGLQDGQTQGEDGVL